MNFSIRRALPEDAPALVTAHNRAWRETYGHLGPPQFFDEREAQFDNDVDWRRRQIEDGEPWTLAVKNDDDGGGVLGLALAGPCLDEDGSGLELYVLYTLREVHGRGVGQALLEAVIGTQAASLWVLEDNPRARAFYERNRFGLDGTRKKVKEEGSSLQEVRMVRA